MNILGQFLSQFKIRTQILVGVAPIIIALFVTYYISDQNFRAFKSSLAQQNNASRSALLLSDLDTQIAKIQRGIFVYSQMGYSGVKRKIYYTRDIIDDLLVDAEPYIQEQGPMFQEDFGRLKEHYNRYNESFDAFAQQKEEISTISEQQIFPRLYKITETLVEHTKTLKERGDLQGALMVKNAKAGLYKNIILVRSFIFIPDNTTVKSVNDNMGVVLDLVKEDPELQYLTEDIKSIQVDLKSLFAKKRTNIYLLNVVLAGSSAEIDNLSNSLRSNASDQVNEINRYIIMRLDQTRNFYEYIALSALLLSLLSAWLVSSGISGPVKEITDTFDILTAGELLGEDIPGSKRRDEVGRLAKSADEYKQMVNVLNAAKEELRAANRDLKVKNSTLEEFAKIAAHDLKEPIRNIHLTADMIKEDHGDDLSEDVSDKLDKISQQSQRLKALVTDLLLYSRFGVEKENIKILSVKDVVEKVKEVIGERIDSSVKVVVESRIPDIQASEEKISAIFRNLITNAIKYNDNKKKIIVIGSKPCDVKGKVIIFVKDNGIGIEERHQKRVFDIFKRLHHRDQYGGGTGMGLSIVDNAIKSMDESIWIESELGSGTTFYFTVRRSS